MEDEEREMEDTVNELDVVENSMPSFSPVGADPSGSLRGRSRAERQSSVSSIMSDDSYEMIEEAGRAVGAAVGLSRMNSVG